MHRCTQHVIGLAFVFFFASASCAHAQNLLGPIPTKASRPEMIDVPVVSVEVATPAPKTELPISPNTGMLRGDTPRPKQVYSIAELALQSSEYMDSRYVANSQHPDDLGIWEQTCIGYRDQFHRLWNDAKNFYATDNLLCVGLVVAAAAPMANTHADQGIRNWYQAQASVGQSGGADRLADVGKTFGEYWYTVPALMAMSFSGHLFPEHALLSPVGEFGDRSLRAMAVGAPTIGILQVSLGGQRPPTGGSHWQAFDYGRGVSGHAFIGAIPFLTAASMVENRPLKTLLFAGSMWTGWSRIHHDDHYFSQVFIGWSIAFLATQAVNQTEGDSFRIVPMAFPNGTGMGLCFQY